MRRLFLAFAATALLAACSSDNSAGMSGAGGATAGGPAGGYGQGAVGSSALGAPGGGMGGTSGMGTGELAQGVPDRVFFDTDQSSLSPQARDTLDRQAAWLQQTPRVAVQIAGNCDERGTEEYNLALGERRANAARDYLVSRGVQGSRINTISYGKNRPVALGSNPQAWAQNRNAITLPHGGVPQS